MRVVNWRKDILGAKHIDTLQAMTVLGTVHALRCKYEEARMIYKEVLIELEKIYGENHVETRNHMKLFIKLYFMIPEIQNGVDMINKCVLRSIEDSGSVSLESVNITEFYVNDLVELKLLNYADSVYMKLYYSTQTELGSMNIKTAELALRIGNFHHLNCNNEKAISMYERSYAGFIQIYGESNQITVDIMKLIERIKIKKSLQ